MQGITITPADGATAMPVGPGLVIVAPLYLSHDDPDGYRVRARIEPQGGRLVATELTVAQRPGGPAVTVEGIRSLGIAPLIRAAAECLESAADTEAGQYRTPEVDLAPDNIARLLRAGATEETLDVAAYVYRRAVALGEPPAVAVQNVFGITRSKAGRWISQARDLGFLGASEGSGKASV